MPSHEAREQELQTRVFPTVDHWLLSFLSLGVRKKKLCPAPCTLPPTFLLVLPGQGLYILLLVIEEQIQAWEPIMALQRLPGWLDAVACGLLFFLLHVNGETP